MCNKLIYIYFYVYVYVYSSMQTCTHMHTHTQTHTHTDNTYICRQIYDQVIYILLIPILFLPLTLTIYIICADQRACNNPWAAIFSSIPFHKRKGGQVRFTNDQTVELEKKFAAQKYLSPSDRKKVAKKLQLSERQVSLNSDGASVEAQSNV